MADGKRYGQKKISSEPIGQRRRRRSRTGAADRGRLITWGCKTLVSTIPSTGKILSGVVDYTFKPLGLVDDLSRARKGRYLNDIITRYVSLAARFNIHATCILAGSRTSLSVDSRSILTQYADARIVNLMIKLIPSGILSSRSGCWHIGFQPFFNDSDETRAGIAEKTWVPTEQGIHRTYLSATGPASKPLVIEYTPAVQDGRAYMFNPLDSAFGQISIRYDCYDREKYLEFTPEDFNCDTIVSGLIETRVTSSMPSTNHGAYRYDVFVTDKLGRGTINLQQPGIRSVNLRLDTCIPDDSYCINNGLVIDVVDQVSTSSSSHEI